MALVYTFDLHEVLHENSGVKVGRKNGGWQGGSIQEFPRIVRKNGVPPGPVWVSPLNGKRTGAKLDKTRTKFPIFKGTP